MIATTRPFSRSLCTVAYFSSAGASTPRHDRATAGRAGRLGLLGDAVDAIDRRLVGRVARRWSAARPLARRCGRGPRGRSPRRSRSSGRRGRRPGPAGARRRRRRGPTSPPCGHRPGRSGSQFFCFLATNDHISSSWTSRVSGGKGHELVVGVPGVLSGLAGQPHDGVAVDADEPFGLADAVALDQVFAGRRRPSPGASRSGTAACPCVRRSGTCRPCSRAGGSGRCLP